MRIWSFACGAGGVRRGKGPRRRGGWRGGGAPSFVLRRRPERWPILPQRSRLRRRTWWAPAIALAFPDRLARRRDATGADWLSVGGRGFRLDPASPLAREAWLAVAEVGGAASGARILSAAPIDQATVESLFAERIAAATQVAFDPATGSVRASHGRRLGAITLSGGQDSRADPAAVEAALLEGVRAHGLALLPWSDAASALRTRAAFARRIDPAIADLSDDALLAALDDWLPALLAGKRRLGEIDPAALSGTLDALLGWEGRKAVDRLAPSHFETPAGSRHPIDYEAEAGPTVETRVQTLFGLAAHPDCRATARSRSCSASPRPPAARSRRRATCRASGKAAGPRSRRRCAAAIRNIPGRTILPLRRRRPVPNHGRAEIIS